MSQRVPDGFHAFARRLAHVPDFEIVIYEVDPSVGAHTDLGTLGIVYCTI